MPVLYNEAKMPLWKKMFIFSTLTIGTLTIGTLTIGTLTIGTLTIRALTIRTITMGTKIITIDRRTTDIY